MTTKCKISKAAGPALQGLVLSLLFVSTAVAQPSTTALDQHGNAFTWKAQPGAVTIIDFAASWCEPCRQTLPKLQQLADAQPEIRVLVISVDDTEAGRDALVRDLGLSIPVLWDQDHAAAEHYRPTGMPSTFLFDAEGRQVLSYAGSKKKDWRALVETATKLTTGPPSEHKPAS